MRTLVFPSLLLLAALPTAAGAEYRPCPSTDWAVSILALEVEQAFVTREGLALRSAMTDLREAVTCLEESISPETAAAVHRAVALVASSQGDEAIASAAMQAALLADPGWEPGPELAPPASSLAMTIDWARVEQAPTRSTLTATRGLALRLDGSPSWRRADRLPVLLQLIDTRGGPVGNSYLLPGDPLPDGVSLASGADGGQGRAKRAPLLEREPEPRAVEARLPREPRTAGGRVLLVGGAGALAAGAVGLGAASMSLRNDWQASAAQCEARSEGCSPVTVRAMDQTQRQADRTGLGAILAGAGAAALGLTVALAWEW